LPGITYQGKLPNNWIIGRQSEHTKHYKDVVDAQLHVSAFPALRKTVVEQASTTS